MKNEIGVQRVIIDCFFFAWFGGALCYVVGAGNLIEALLLFLLPLVLYVEIVRINYFRPQKFKLDMVITVKGMDEKEAVSQFDNWGEVCINFIAPDGTIIFTDSKKLFEQVEDVLKDCQPRKKGEKVESKKDE